jgi:hypothetical protein
VFSITKNKREKFILTLEQRNVMKTVQVGVTATLVDSYSEGLDSNLGPNTSRKMLG